MEKINGITTKEGIKKREDIKKNNKTRAQKITPPGKWPKPPEKK